MKKTSLSTDYRSAIVVLLKGKFPSFIFGFIVCAFLGLFITTSFGIGKSNKSKKIVKKDAFTIDEVRTYTVQPGDDLWGIAEKFYGSGFNAYDIAKINNLKEPFVLNENQILIIPKTETKKPTQGEITQSAPSVKHISEYVVLPGEYLWQIAEKIYGDGNQMSKLINANNIPYPYNVEEGQKLIVP